MRDGASGRSRGFGFLTFRDPKTVNVVMVKEHYLDGKIVRPEISTSTKTPSRLMHPPPTFDPKITQSSLSSKIDPKRAIPRDEQERTSKIFVGGVSQDANEHVFKEYFAQFGRVVDATLMMDKDTGRPRGFGFVTFDSEAAVDATLAGDLQILGKPIEVKKAQPRGNMREEEEPIGRGRGGRRGGGKDFRDNDRGGFDGNNNGGNQQGQTNQNQQGGYGGSGMTPQMMAQYWQKMQQYFATMQQQMASAAAMQNGGMPGMGGMNPAMMQQMQAMQQMKAMQAMQQQQQMSRQQGSQSPLPQSPGAQGMTPAMMQQMQQLQQMQMQQAQGGAAAFGGGPVGASPGPGMGFGPPGAGAGRRGTPGYNAQDQLAFEQQKYEQQQARRAAQEAQQMQSYQQGGPTSWEGMYDDVPQPNMGGGGRGYGGAGGRGGSRGSQGPQPGPQSAPPANAPTGPKNAGKPGANYRGGGRGAHRGFHPYVRNG
ncbi:hypothetical protein MMC28_003163 [Mycoblastus sanguinarius]|nr:hypothetical protein [Mycoblastus sanguinarius]